MKAVVQEAKDRAARIIEASELRQLERWLGERRREIDRTFDFRYSILPLIFATLLRDRRLTEDDLHGLAREVAGQGICATGYCTIAVGPLQESLAERTDLHRNYIGGVERGERNVTLEYTAKLAKALSGSRRELFADFP